MTDIKSPNSGSDPLQKRKIINNNENNEANIGKVLKSTNKNSPTGDNGATSLPPIGESFIYIEISSSNHGNIVFVSLERTDIIQTTNITFYYSRYSVLTSVSLISMGHFKIQ